MEDKGHLNALKAIKEYREKNNNKAITRSDFLKIIEQLKEKKDE